MGLSVLNVRVESKDGEDVDAIDGISEKPKSQAIFTMLNRLKRLNYKIGLIRKLKITTWDSPR